MNNSNWIEVFMTGTHTAGNGTTKTYTEDDLQTMAKAYNEQNKHIAPLVLGHPKTDDPAFGWTKELKAVGNKLLAYVDQVSDDIVGAVKAGKYKKISIALYPGGLLRHIGLLGAMPPAVKGLAPVEFAEDEEFEEFVWATDEFRMSTVARVLSNVRDFFIEKFGLDQTDKLIAKGDIEFLQEPVKSVMLKINDRNEIVAPEDINKPPVGAITNNYSETQIKQEEEDMDKLKQAFDEFQKNAVDKAEFSEFKKTMTDFITLVTDRFKTDDEKAKTSKTDTAKITFAENIESLIKDGKILPAEKDFLLEEYADLLKTEESMTFAESVIKPSDRFKAQLEKRPVIVKVPDGPFATKDKASKKTDGGLEVPAEFAEVPNLDEASVEIHNQILKYAEEHKCSYDEAANKIAS